MNSKTFFYNFEIIANAPGGIARLRELILDLAVSGQLLPQLHEDGDSHQLAVDLLKNREKSLVEKSLAIKPLASPDFQNSLFNIPSTWVWVSLGLFCHPQAGFAFKSSQFNTDGRGTPLIRIRDIGSEVTQCHFEGEFRSEFVVQKGDWLIGMDGNFNVRQWSGPDALLNQRVTRLIFLDERIEQRFVAWALQKQVYALMGTKSYTTVDHLSTKQINESLISLPPYAEQKRIVAKVDELMTLCDELEATQNLRNSIRTSARKSAIVAISTATTPEELDVAWKRISENWLTIADTSESIASLRSLILSIFLSNVFDNSQGVRTVKLGDVVRILNGDRSSNYPSKEHRVKSGIPFINAGHLVSGRIDLTEMDYITPQKYESLSGGKIMLNDVLFCLRGSLGKCALNTEMLHGTVASSLTILRSNEYLDANYLLCFLQSGLCGIQIKKYDNGTAQPNLSAKNLAKFELRLPEIEEQKRIVARVNQLMALCDELEHVLLERNELTSKIARTLTADNKN